MAKTIRDPHFETVVGPASELHGTALLVKGEPGDVNLAC